ncbi:hypothetical protein ABW365_19420 [Enterococcus avium]
MTEFLFQADKATAVNSKIANPMIVQTINYSITDLFEFIQGWHNWFKTASSKLTSTLFLNKGPIKRLLYKHEIFGMEKKQVNRRMYWNKRFD